MYLQKAKNTLERFLFSSSLDADRSRAHRASKNVAPLQHSSQSSPKRAASYDSNLNKGHSDSHGHMGLRDASHAQAVFDPQRYQERPGTPNSTSWSFSASSIHSSGNGQGVETPSGDAGHSSKQSREAHLDHHHHHHRPRHQPHVTQGESGFSSQEEFSLQATRKALDFESDSQQSSLHENRSAGGGSGRHPPTGFQTQELVSKVQAYLGQCRSPAGRKSSRSRAGMALPEGSVEFGTPERSSKVCLTEQEVTQCVRPDSADNLSSPRSGSEENQKGVATRGGSQGEVDVPKDPLDTQRLRPIRQKTRNAVVGIALFLRGGACWFCGSTVYAQGLVCVHDVVCQTSQRLPLIGF